jgi:hypothetical protein
VLHAEPTAITVAHWGRLDQGELFAKTRYVDWAVLMKRSFGLDVLRFRVFSSTSFPSRDNPKKRLSQRRADRDKK